MTWITAFFVGILTAVVGAVGGGTLGSLCVNWYRVSSREGESGYFVILLALVGSVAGLIVGLVSTRLISVGASPLFFKSLGVAMGSTVALVAVVTLITWLAADLPTTLRGRPVVLHAEIRCPAGFALPADVKPEAWYGHIDTRSRRVTSRGDLRLKEARTEEGRLIIPMTLELNTSVREKLLYVRLAENVQLFVPIFPSKPGPKFFSWSVWQDGGWEPGKPQPEPAERFNLRFRLDVLPEPEQPAASSAEPTDAELRARNNTENAATLAALTPDSPLEVSLQLTHYSQPIEQRGQAGAIIARRPNVVPEMAAQILSPDQEVADRALRALAVIRPLPSALAQPVARIGERVIERLQRFNASKPPDDPGFQEAANASVLFAAWFESCQALHDHAGSNQLPQLEKILRLAEQRSDSHVIREDVARIARVYVDSWSAETASKN